MQIKVINQLPAPSNTVTASLLDLFQKYTLNTSHQAYKPFEHQAATFDVVEKDQEVFLVAGTAAGKTLAITVPLFAKLKVGRIRKTMLMYPTIALMEDQRKVMDKLAELTGLEVAQIQGGMSRSKLVTALNKPVILATPDAIYWFFRKNVKYSGVLIYALALVDEFVLDEAHLFNGLMLQNFAHLWRRIQTLAGLLGKTPRLHILTATPTDGLKSLNRGREILGRSKCQDVTVEMRPSGRFDRSDAMVAAISEALDTGQRKVLAVCNSARMAHQLFEKYKVSGSVTIPVEHQLRFGKNKLGELLQCLEQAGVEREIVEGISARLFREEDITLSEIPAGTWVKLPFAEVVAQITEILERQCWRVKRALWERGQNPGESWESLLHNRVLPCQIIVATREHLKATSDLEKQQAFVDEWLAKTLEHLGAVEVDETIPCESPDFLDLQKTLAAGLGQALADLVVKRLTGEMKINPDWLLSPIHSLSNLSSRPIYLRWIEWLVEKEHVARVRAILQQGLASGILKAEWRHIGLWKGTNVPVIVYSGSMAKHARAGLIDVFADLEKAVLISTSAVEVGVDFHADTLITEECEGNAFLQRLGRVGRHGDASRVIVLAGGDANAQLCDLDGQSISREMFAERIKQTFPQRNYASASQWVDANHYLVNEQLGRIGARLNAAPDLAAAQELAEQLRAADISLGFGLRSTLPQIALKDGVTKDPFYILHYVDDQDLRPPDSPFEVARAKIWFTGLIFQRSRFNVFVDLCETLKASRYWFKMTKGGIKPQLKPGIGAEYAARMQSYFDQQDNWHLYHPGNFLLLYGDVYLNRTDKEVLHPETVRDDEQNPLFLPNQTYLVFLGWCDVDAAKKEIENSPIAAWEELHYDWDGIEWNNALVILEQTAGACFAAYKEWLDYVNRRVSK